MSLPHGGYQVDGAGVLYSRAEMRMMRMGVGQVREVMSGGSGERVNGEG
jgi:hypothetical protein